MVPVVDLVLPKGGKALEDVMSGGIGLGVEEGAIVVHNGLCGGSKVI